VHVPPDLVARVEGRSSIGRLAILVHATAGFIDPGFEGEITLELSNLGPTPASLYGPARGSKYSGQKGPTPSRLEEDLTKEREQ
jgi:dCTP deaminase